MGAVEPTSPGRPLLVRMSCRKIDRAGFPGARGPQIADDPRAKGHSFLPVPRTLVPLQPISIRNATYAFNAASPTNNG